MTKKILVTGACGMIGYRLCESLYQQNIPFVGLDLKSPDKTSVPLHFFVKADCLNLNQLSQLKDSFHMVIHLAAHASVIPTIKNPQLAIDNILMTYNVLEFCRSKRINKLLFSSSREVYGSQKDHIFMESDSNSLYIKNPYGASKLSCESLISSYAKSFNISSIICRFSNIYGLYDFSSRVIPTFIKKSFNNERISIFGSEKILDFLFIDDCIDIINKLITYRPNTSTYFVNLMSNTPTSLINLAHIVKEKTNSSSEVVLLKNRSGETEYFVGSNKKLLLDIKPKPLTSLSEGLDFSISWYKDYFLLK